VLLGGEDVLPRRRRARRVAARPRAALAGRRAGGDLVGLLRAADDVDVPVGRSAALLLAGEDEELEPLLQAHGGAVARVPRPATHLSSPAAPRLPAGSFGSERRADRLRVALEVLGLVVARSGPRSGFGAARVDLAVGRVLEDRDRLAAGLLELERVGERRVEPREADLDLVARRDGVLLERLRRRVRAVRRAEQEPLARRARLARRDREPDREVLLRRGGGRLARAAPCGLLRLGALGRLHERRVHSLDREAVCPRLGVRLGDDAARRHLARLLLAVGAGEDVLEPLDRVAELVREHELDLARSGRGRGRLGAAGGAPG